MVKLSSIEAMLERQAKRSEVQDRMARKGSRAVQQDSRWITISRQLGSGGTELGGRLADELDWRVYDHEIVSAISESIHTKETVLSWLDEQSIGPITDYLSRLMNSEIPGQLPYVQEMVRVVGGLARKGDAIILGRGANWFLDPRFGLRLRIIAPFDERVARIVRDERADQGTAEEMVREHDTRQAQFVRGVFGHEIDDPEGYDCVLNAASLGSETAAAIVLAALRQKLQLEL